MKPRNDSLRFQNFLRRKTKEQYLFLAGHLPKARLAELQHSFSDLFSVENLILEKNLVKSSLSTVRTRQAQLRLLERGSQYLCVRTQNLVDEIESWLIRQKVMMGNKEISIQAIPQVISNSKKTSDRRVLSEKYLHKICGVYPQIIEYWRKNYETISELHYDSYAEAFAEWKKLNLDLCLGLAKTGLASTRKLYFRSLDFYSPSMRPSGRFFYYDIPWILRGHKWDNYFPKRNILKALLATTQQMGFRKRSAQSIHFDFSSRKKKTNRPFCAAVRVPKEIYLVASLYGDYRDYEAVYHEAGHAFHFSSMSTTLPWEARCIIDDSVAETYAYLFAHLIRSEEYLIRHLGFTSVLAKEFVDFGNFSELVMFRRYCAKAIYEIILHRHGHLDSSIELYGSLMKEALGIEMPGEIGLFEMDPGLYSLQYLQAWFLEASLYQKLTEEFGVTWFESNEAGLFLRSLWSIGFLETSDSLSSKLSMKRTNIGHLLTSFTVNNSARMGG